MPKIFKLLLLIILALLIYYFFSPYLGKLSVLKITNNIPVKLSKFPPSFWDKDKNVFISGDNLLGFNYSNDLAVIQKKTFSSEYGNIYVIPKNVDNLESYDLTGGFSVTIEKYTSHDIEVPFESATSLIRYNTVAFRIENNMEEFDGVVFFNEVKGTYILKSRFPKHILCINNHSVLPYEAIYIVYKTEPEKDKALGIVNSIITNCDYDLKSNNKSTYTSTPITKESSANTILSNNLNISIILPRDVTYKEINNLDQSYSFIVDNANVIISRNPQYVGFSMSGALCANNSSADRCGLVGKYLIPELGNHMTVVEDQQPNGTQLFRGVIYTDQLSASISASNMKDLIKYLSIVSSIRNIK